MVGNKPAKSPCPACSGYRLIKLICAFTLVQFWTLSPKTKTRSMSHLVHFPQGDSNETRVASWAHPGTSLASVLKQLNAWDYRNLHLSAIFAYPNGLKFILCRNVFFPDSIQTQVTKRSICRQKVCKVFLQSIQRLQSYSSSSDDLDLRGIRCCAALKAAIEIPLETKCGKDLRASAHTIAISVGQTFTA